MATKYSIITKQGTDEKWNPVSRIGGFIDSEGLDAADPAILGGKGAGLDFMHKLGMPVPDGFTIHTEACVAYQLKPKGTYWTVGAIAKNAYKELKTRNGGVAPLVSVRSGAKQSMPGMLSTVCNVGLTSKTFSRWAKALGERAAFDCKRRLIQSYGTVVFGISKEPFESGMAAARETAGVEADADLPQQTIEDLCNIFTELLADNDVAVPDTIEKQLVGAVCAVFESWNNPEAIHWRAMHGITEDGGTAVNVQTMVFGNAPGASGTGVLFTRNPATGEGVMMAEWMPNAQGEDLVAGVRTPSPIEAMEKDYPKQYEELFGFATDLERVYSDMRDIEFTVENGRLWLLQDRCGKRSDAAAVRIAVEMAEDNTITKEVALSRIDARTIGQMTGEKREEVDPAYDIPPDATGKAASPGIVKGVIVQTAALAVGFDVDTILVRETTDTADLAGMEAAVGIVTETGGVTSHAAVVSRAINTPCIVGSDGLLAAIAMAGAKTITMDGSTGRVWFDRPVPIVTAENSRHAETLVEWGFEKLGAVRQTSTLTGANQRVLCASWHDWDEAGKRSIAVLKDEKIPVDNVLMDLRSAESFARDEDKGLTQMFGVDTVPDSTSTDTDEVLSSLLEVKAGRGVAVYLPDHLKEYGGLLKEKGFKVSLEVSSVADLFEANSAVSISTETVKEVFGDYSAYQKVLDLIAGSGVKLTAIPVGVSDAEMIEQVFGKGG